MSKSYYKRLDSEECDEVDDGGAIAIPTTTTTRRPRTNVRGVLLTGAVLAFFFILGGGGWRWSAMKQAQKYEYTSCGSTSFEARATGCRYAKMGRTWVPPECFYDEDVANDPTLLDKDWYMDWNLTIPADEALVASGDLELVYTQHYHEEHCLYVMRQIAVALALKKPMIPSIVARLGHINHCAQNIVDIIFKAYDENERQFFANDVTESLLEFEICVPLR